MGRRRCIGDYEEFLQILGEIVKESEAGSPIVVEGEKDLEALRAVGVRGTIIVYKSKQHVLRSIDSMKPARVILLLDLDYEGVNKTIYLKKLLEGSVKNVDLTYWSMLSKFRRLGLTTIESIPRILDRMVK